MNKEIDYVDDMPRKAVIELHQSRETGRWYISFIEHVSERNGEWRTKRIYDDAVYTLFKIMDKRILI